MKEKIETYFIFKREKNKSVTKKNLLQICSEADDKKINKKYLNNRKTCTLKLETSD